MNLLLALILTPAFQAGPDEVVRMRDGRILVGEISYHDLDGFVLVEARDGARFALSWEDLFPGEGDRLKSRFGYRIETSVPMVTADRLLLVNGMQLTGRILRRDSQFIEFRVKDIVSMVPIARLAAPPEPVVVEATTILTPEQFYRERVLEVDPEDGLDQFRFALELQTVFALDQANSHLQAARALAVDDPALLRRIDGVFTTLQITLANRDQAEALESVRQLIHRERFAQAEKELAAFSLTFPNSDLETERRDMEDRFEGQRAAAMERFLVRNWHLRAIALVKRRSLDRNANVEEILGWIEAEVPTLIRRSLLEDLQKMKADVDESAIDPLWQNRYAHSPKRRQAGFGTGSWILGEDRARAGLDEEEVVDDGKSPEQREMEERTRRFLENLERQRRATSGDQEVSPEDWWRKTSATERFQFLLAYYAEFGGDYEITSVRFDNCTTCSGSGIITSLETGAQGGRQRKKKCPLCHGVGIKRGVTFR